MVGQPAAAEPSPQYEMYLSLGLVVKDGAAELETGTVALAVVL